MNNTGKHWDSASIAMVFHFGIGVLMLLLARLAPAAAGLPGADFFITMALGAYLFYAQHNFPGVRFTEKDGWTYARRRAGTAAAT